MANQTFNPNWKILERSHYHYTPKQVKEEEPGENNNQIVSGKKRIAIMSRRLKYIFVRQKKQVNECQRFQTYQSHMYMRKCKLKKNRVFEQQVNENTSDLTYALACIFSSTYNSNVILFLFSFLELMKGEYRSPSKGRIGTITRTLMSF